MTGKERIFAVMRGQESDLVPWVPFAGVHAGKLKGYSANEVYTDVDKLCESLREVKRLYEPDGLPVVFDLQLEAEALGCSLVWADDAPPTVSSHPLAEVDLIPDRIPSADDGRIPLFLEAMRRMKGAVGETTALYGLLCGPFTLASHLRGTNIFMDMMMKPDYVHKLLDYTKKIALAMCEYYTDAGMDCIALVDPLISQISPDHFNEFMYRPFSEVFEAIRKAGKISSFFVCGNATANIEPMCTTKPDSISVDENVDLPRAKEICDRHKIAIAGNIPLTTVMLFGNQQDNMKAATDLIDALPSTRGFILSPGCDMPYDTPVENSIAIKQAVKSPEQTRKMLANYQKEDLLFEGNLPDYQNLSRPLLEVFTLDSASCAACTYMLASAMEMKDHFGDGIDIVEYKYTTPQNIARTREMGVKQLPSIYINGKLAYSSIIPGKQELIDKVRELSS